MSSKGIHIVSLDVPFPADYGAMIDIYYRCKFLRLVGMKVILHCFEYGRGKQKALEEVADEIYYYKRKKSVFSVISRLPFIVQTRRNVSLLNNLQKDDFPILFEGIHTCFLLNHPTLKTRWKGVRAHNIEHEYYAELSKIEKNFLKRKYFSFEAKKLARFEKIYHFADEILSVTPKDNLYFQEKYQKGVYIPVFNPLSWGEGERGIGNYALFHGNLSVVENENAFRFITDKIWDKKFPLQLYVAGKKPSDGFKKYLTTLPFEIKCFPNPSNEELNLLIRQAKINLLPTFQATGIKHKLLNCLANGGHCLANTPMVEGTGLEQLCELANTEGEWKTKIEQLSHKENDQDQFLERSEILKKQFDCLANAQKIMALTENTKNSVV